MLQELAAMGKSYDEQMDGQYIGTMASVYKEGADKVDGLLWQYATAKRDTDIKLLATTHEIRPEAAKALYYTMAGLHTTAAIGGALYRMNTSNSAKGNMLPKGLPIPDGLSKEIHPDHPGKHIPGYNNYTPGRSPLVDGVDPHELLNGVHAGGYQIIRVTPRNQPVVNFGKPIGTYEGQPTSYGIIHSGENGAHVVPANPVRH